MLRTLCKIGLALVALASANASILSAQTPLVASDISRHFKEMAPRVDQSGTDSPIIAARGDLVINAIRKASDRTGVDYDYLLATAQIESGLNPRARAKTSSARGLYQFIESTWLASLERHAGRFDLTPSKSEMGGAPQFMFEAPHSRQSLLEMRHEPRLAALIAAAETLENRRFLRGALGREASRADLYLAHFLG